MNAIDGKIPDEIAPRVDWELIRLGVYALVGILTTAAIMCGIVKLAELPL